MKLSNFLKQAQANKVSVAPRLHSTASAVKSYVVESIRVRPEQLEPSTSLFPTSGRFHRYLDCIKKRDPLLYERIVGLH